MGRDCGRKRRLVNLPYQSVMNERTGWIMGDFWKTTLKTGSELIGTSRVYDDAGFMLIEKALNHYWCRVVLCSICHPYYSWTA